jgi:SAM-dependent methyltransferase
MTNKTDLYNSAYSNYGLDLYAGIRVETYGEDLGQTSWVTSRESLEIPVLLEIGPASKVLEIGCGSGRYALRVAEQTGCQLVGVDINPHGILNANHLARSGNMASLVRFEQHDVSKALPFENGTFDAIFSNDSLCHMPARRSVLVELARVLKPGGRLLFSDALVVGGLLTNEEIATRSSIGIYVFSPAGTNEGLMEQVGLRVDRAEDTTDKMADIAKRWHDSRRQRAIELVAVEGAANFDGLQRFLSCVCTLALERRLLRLMYLAHKPPNRRA